MFVKLLYDCPINRGLNQPKLKNYLFLPNSHCTLVPSFTAQTVPEITAVYFPEITALLVPVYASGWAPMFVLPTVALKGV